MLFLSGYSLSAADIPFRDIDLAPLLESGLSFPRKEVAVAAASTAGAALQLPDSGDFFTASLGRLKLQANVEAGLLALLQKKFGQDLVSRFPFSIKRNDVNPHLRRATRRPPVCERR